MGIVWLCVVDVVSHGYVWWNDCYGWMELDVDMNWLWVWWGFCVKMYHWQCPVQFVGGYMHNANFLVLRHMKFSILRCHTDILGTNSSSHLWFPGQPAQGDWVQCAGVPVVSLRVQGPGSRLCCHGNPGHHGGSGWANQRAVWMWPCGCEGWWIICFLWVLPAGELKQKKDHGPWPNRNGIFL